MRWAKFRAPTGKRRPGPTRHGSMWLRTALTEAAQAAARTKGTYLVIRPALDRTGAASSAFRSTLWA